VPSGYKWRKQMPPLKMTDEVRAIIKDHPRYAKFLVFKRFLKYVEIGDGVKQPVIAKKFNIHQATVSKVVNMQQWKDRRVV
jgi:hypothetical protein